MRYAQLLNSTVVNVIDSPSAPDAGWIACDNAGPGYTYNGTVFTVPTAALPAWHWYIDVGPFYDRFGAAKMAVLTSVDAGVMAIRSDLSVRKWVDLQRADVASSLAYVGSKVPSVTALLQTSILTTVPTPFENLALRKSYF